MGPLAQMFQQRMPMQPRMRPNMGEPRAMQVGPNGAPPPPMMAAPQPGGGLAALLAKSRRPQSAPPVRAPMQPVATPGDYLGPLPGVR